jgi:hypothetical protein
MKTAPPPCQEQREAATIRQTQESPPGGLTCGVVTAMTMAPWMVAALPSTKLYGPRCVLTPPIDLQAGITIISK